MGLFSPPPVRLLTLTVETAENTSKNNIAIPYILISYRMETVNNNYHMIVVHRQLYNRHVQEWYFMLISCEADIYCTMAANLLHVGLFNFQDID